MFSVILKIYNFIVLGQKKSADVFCSEEVK